MSVEKEVKKIEKRQTNGKSYIVKYTEDGKKNPKKETIEGLKEARVFALGKYREGTLVSLTNIVGMPLPLTRVIYQEETQPIQI